MRKFIQTLLIACCMAASMVAMAQDACQVKGVVVDATGETVPYATVGAYEGTKNVTRLAADANGTFAMQLIQGKKYNIEITSVGYSPYRTEVKVPALSAYDMGNIVLKSSTELEEVVVVSQKPIIKSDAEKITYDVTADPESDGKTLLDMLRKVPMVTVDGEDNVQLNGSGDFKVLINGKESTMIKNNMKEVFKAMPASGVQDIQVMTNPSTRYDAEGAGGIINIITVRSEVSDVTGVTGTLSAYCNALQGSFGGNAYLTMQHKKFTASLNYFGGKFNNYQYSDAVRYNYNNPDMYYTEINTSDFGDMKVGGQFHFLTK